MDSKETTLRIGDIRDNDSDQAVAVVDEGMRRHGAIRLIGEGSAARLLASIAGLTLMSSAGAAQERANRSATVLKELLTIPKYRLSVSSKVGKRVSMSVANARRAAAKKRRVKAHRARR